MQKELEIIGDKEITWLRKQIETPSPSGNERKGQESWLNFVRPFVDDHFVDAYGSAAAIINPGKEFKVVIEAHADEIGWYVHKIDTDGFIHVEETGGMDPGIAPSQRVKIHTAKGEVDAIFGWPAIHTREVSQDAPKKSSIFIDCGCGSREEVEALGIQVGDLITYTAGLLILNKKFFVGRAMDNRVGGFIITRTAQLLREQNIQLPYSLYIVNSVQEEIGTKGAIMMANSIKPNCAFVVDVTHDTNTPMMDKIKEGDLAAGKGPVIIKAPPIHLAIHKLLIDTAKENRIPIQYAAMAKETGTDADAFAYEAGGIPTGLISFSLRYMHTTVETIHRSYVENSIRLLFHSLQKLSPEFNFQYLT